MATNNNQIAATILAQTIIVANEAAASAAAAAASAESVATKADIHSPAFTGTPTAPTPAQNNNSTQLSTTAYLDRLLGVANGLPTLDATGKIPIAQIPPISITAVYVVASEAAMLALAAAIGNIAIRTDLSNAEFILSALPASTLGNWIEVGTSPVLSVAGLTGAISATDLTAELIVFVGDSGAGGTSGSVPAPGAGDAAAGKFLFAGGGFTTIPAVALADGFTGTGAFARAASPTFSGTPAGPTAAVDTNSGQFATTAFVLAQASASGDGNPVMDGVASRGSSTHYARADHVHPTDTSRASLASPTFTGTPAAPTAAADTNTTQVSTTAFVVGQASASTPANNGTAAVGTSLKYARADHVHNSDSTKANLASPTFTGVPATPTAAGGTNTTQIATTEFVLANAAPVPTSYLLPVGAMALVWNISGGAVASGDTVAGSGLTLNGPSSASGPGVQTGTWTNISNQSATASNGPYLFVRSA